MLVWNKKLQSNFLFCENLESFAFQILRLFLIADRKGFCYIESMTENENNENNEIIDNEKNDLESKKETVEEQNSEILPDISPDFFENKDSSEGEKDKEDSDSEEDDFPKLRIKISTKGHNSDSEDESNNSDFKKRIEKAITSSLSSALNNAFMSLDAFIPTKINILPLAGHPIFPGVFTPLVVNSPEDTNTIEEAMENNGFLGLVLTKNDEENPSMSDLYKYGTVAKIVKKINLPDGGINIFISTLKRFKIKKTVSASAPLVASVEYLEDEETDTFEVKALTRAVVSEMKDISENNPLFTEEMRLNMVNIENPGKIADFVSTILNVERENQQKILEEINVRRRMEQVLVFIKKDQDLIRIQKKIQDELRENFEKNQRDYFLRQEMKMIQDELGSGADGSDYQKLKAKIDEFKFEGEIKETLDNELEKFKLMDPNASEYFMERNYLELVVSLPWNDDENQSFDIKNAYKVLEKDHYGLDDVKKRILEYLSVRKLKNDNKGSIMILVGPPGVGKTSIGRSIAEAMNKPFYRFSVGGMRDEAEIKGHRRTYIGALPGKILQGLKISKTKSPVFMIDEIDKMGASYSGGDPASALLEVLDPEQNINFRDTYLDLPFDVSNVFFVLTANSLDTIPGPLLDRAEIIQLSGYIDQEKIEIAKKYLIPKTLVKNGLAKNQVKFTKEALFKISEEYAREAGVRHYEKCIDKICRKIVLENLTGISADVKKLSDAKIDNSNSDLTVEGKTFTVDVCDLEKYLGKPIFDESEIKKADVAGTAIGLAWTSMGGDTLLLESIYFPTQSGGLQLTGQMGDVMKESAQIAFNWVRYYAIEHAIKPMEWFEKNTIHLHIPEGATPKDGPSAGITMATTFMSLLTGRPIKPNVAMTGELDLTGHVMAIGGLREKTVAAKRNGIKTIYIPKANERDLEEIPEIVKNGIKFIPVKHAMEVMTTVFQAEEKKTEEGYGF